MSVPDVAPKTVAVLATLPRGEKSQIRIELRNGPGGFFVALQYYAKFSAEDWERDDQARGAVIFPEDLNAAAMAFQRAIEEIVQQ